MKLAKIDPKSKQDPNMTINTGMVEIHLKFNSSKEKKDWYEAIIECQKRLQEKK